MARRGPRPETREELASAHRRARRHRATLAAPVRGTLEFGTAGLRGELGAGPNADEPRRRHPRRRRARRLPQRPGPRRRPVVIGYDARHKSADFARDTAAVMTGAGLRGAGAARARCPPRCWPSPSATSAPPPASWSPRATTRRRTTATRSTSATAPRSCRRPTREIAAADRRRRRRVADVPRGRRRLGRRSARTSLERLPRPRRRRRPTAGRPARPARRLHAAARRRQRALLAAFARAGFPAAVRGRRAGRARPGLPDRRLPQPGGAGRDGPRLRDRPRAPTPDIVIANDPDADRCAVAVPTRTATAGGCCAATRSARCSPTHLVRRGLPPARVSPARSCRPRCSAGSPQPPGSGYAGDADRLQVDRPGRRACATATRRRSATASTPKASGTRTASRPRCSSPSWPRR